MLTSKTGLVCFSCKVLDVTFFLSCAFISVEFRKATFLTWEVSHVGDLGFPSSSVHLGSFVYVF